MTASPMDTTTRWRLVLEFVLLLCLGAAAQAARQFFSSGIDIFPTVLEIQSDENVPALDDVENKPNFICTKCLQLSKHAEELLSNPDTPTHAREFLAEHVCYKFTDDPEKKCEELLDTYIPVALAKLQEYMAPGRMCMGSGLCRNDSKSLIANAENCVVCRYVVVELKIKLQDPKTQMKLIEILLDGCQKVPNHVDQCQTAVLEYVPLLLANLKTVLDPNVLCAKIGACPAVPGAFSAMTQDSNTELPSVGFVQSS
ncbi:hypothetical protein O6H91_11G113200 [Diphasiastrum complanatum]|uniref:Uncharacterized protein n=1 Tax=Diphasiastrum complanatum TaxID=34168 RepID=A0ACC2CCT9_DIPCM|nr:hypothetical protein O6H91_11G113200 [Diphasiastrum complanatum]